MGCLKEGRRTGEQNELQPGRGDLKEREKEKAVKRCTRWAKKGYSKWTCRKEQRS